MADKPRCFVIMPISTPPDRLTDYDGEENHFRKILKHLFIPAVEKADFDPIPPEVTGSSIIQADIIKYLAESELVLCDISVLNPNVFFEYGIRTALDVCTQNLSGDERELITTGA